MDDLRIPGKEQRKGQNMEPIRLNKYLSEQGVCSRREADRLIEAGKVTIDGRKAGMGEKVTGQEAIVCDGKPVGQGAGEKKVKPVLLAVNKPRGVVCTTSDKDRAMNVVELVHYPARVYPVGRLDKDSEGLLLMTNQGELANEIMHAGNFHEKEYIVTVDQPFNSAFIKKMQEGVELKELNVTTRPCKVKALGKKTFQITLTQGLNRQIRRMCEALGYHVVTLKRVRIMNIHLGRLNTGDYRRVTPQELEELQWQLEQARMEREEEES
jgi:23S rRNA pseudouridine2604 synthase